MNPLLAKRFVAGTKLDDALLKSRALINKGLNVTLDHLGEDVKLTSQANKATNDYITILNKLKENKLNANIAVKLSQIGLAINYDLALKNIKEILAIAKKNQLNVEIDMEGSDYVEDTINIYLKTLKRFPNTILAIQAYLYRSLNDVKNIAKKKGSVRIVKGSYKEPTNIAYQNKVAVDKNYVLLLENSLKKCNFTFIATHDDKIIDKAIKFIKKNKIKSSKYEFQMLYGIRSNLQEQLVRDGHETRVYVPYGSDWFPYFLRRIKERKENFFFLLKNLFRK